MASLELIAIYELEKRMTSSDVSPERHIGVTFQYCDFEILHTVTF
jgi:hypothetical protein